MFCSKCGSPVPDGSPSCPNCGAVFSSSASQPTYQKPPTPMFAPADIEENRGVAILTAIFNSFFWIPIIYDKSSPYGMFYANNAVLLIILSAIVSIISSILFFTIIIPIAAAVFLMVLWIMNLVNACKGYEKPLPLVGKYVIFRAKR